jgi:hypothetical protein
MGLTDGNVGKQQSLHVDFLHSSPNAYVIPDLLSNPFVMGAARHHLEEPSGN